jgi:integrator complex subunit 7
MVCSILLQAAVTPSYQLSFQITYAKLRADMLQAHSLLLAACASMKSCPPPAIATAVAMTTGQDVHTLSHFAVQVLALFSPLDFFKKFF